MLNCCYLCQSVVEVLLNCMFSAHVDLLLNCRFSAHVVPMCTHPKIECTRCSLCAKYAKLYYLKIPGPLPNG